MNVSTITVSEANTNILNNLIIMGNCLVEKVVERCAAVVYMGSVQYLSHAERTAIISGCGQDFDVVPSDFDGPAYKDKESYRFLEHHEYDRFVIVTGWDGEKYPVYFEAMPDEDGYTSCCRAKVAVLYQDGECYLESQADFRVLVGKDVNPRLHGRPTDPREVVFEVAAPVYYPKDDEDIPF